MEVYQLHGPRRLYWLLPNWPIKFSDIMSRHRFESILQYLQFSFDEDPDTQVLVFLDAVNSNFKKALTAGTYITPDESMVKSFHRSLKGKIKIIRKPRPIGNELKTLSDGASNICIHAELYEGKDFMKDKPYVKEFGATTATTLRITEHYHGTGRIVIADSWFGSVKCAVQLYNRGLYSIMLVKNNSVDFPKERLAGIDLERGEHYAFNATKDGVQLQACRFVDLQIKDFISTCSTVLPGNPRKTRHHGDIPRPKVAETYLKYSASIDIHNHVRTGSQALEDAWKTHNPRHRQIGGILGFCFTNAYQAYNYFKEKVDHYEFKIAAVQQMITFSTQGAAEERQQQRVERQVGQNLADMSTLHQIEMLPYSVIC